MTPIAASQKEHESKVYWNVYGNLLPLKPAKFKVGDKVRITKKKAFLKRDTSLDGPKKSFRCPTVKQITNVLYKGF